MMITVDERNRAAHAHAVRSMFEARKRVFVDLLRWDLPVLADRFEVDQFDDGHATYLILVDAARRHLASARLLPTTRPHILSSLFPDLCEGAPPAGPDVLEITRFCLSRDLRAPERRSARDQLVTAIARFALDTGVRTYTGVAELPWLQQILAFGWDCMPLGLPHMHGRQTLGALRIDIDEDTPGKLAAAGVYAEVEPSRPAAAAA